MAPQKAETIRHFLLECPAQEKLSSKSGKISALKHMLDDSAIICKWSTKNSYPPFVIIIDKWKVTFDLDIRLVTSGES